jgi:putative glutamine amidotransferase
MSDRPKIGVSACFLYPDANRPAFAKKTLQYLEQSVPHWAMAAGAMPVMVPALVGDTARGDVTAQHYAAWLDGLMLHGGVDMSPTSYGEEALDPLWAGDRSRDLYEMELVRAFVAAGKPVFGICRGLQLINVSYGGTLYQDISTQRPEARVHRDGEAYDRLFHDVQLVPGSRLETLLNQSSSRKVNSIHHQGIKDLAPGFVAEALCPEDGTIEAIRHSGDAWVAAVQWHPEFHKPEYGVMDDSPLLHDFLQAARAARS